MAGDAFNKFKSSLNRGITTISVKTSSTLEKSRIKTHIESINRDIEKDFISIGEEAYKLWLNGETDFSSLFSHFEAIKGKYKEVDDLSKQLASIDERDSQILGNGTTKTGETEQRHFCTNCGTQYETPVKFCRNCGNKMEE